MVLFPILVTSNFFFFVTQRTAERRGFPYGGNRRFPRVLVVILIIALYCIEFDDMVVVFFRY